MPDNDRDIFEAMLERMLGEPEESGVEASGFATPEVATTARAAEPTNEEPVSDATVTGS